MSHLAHIGNRGPARNRRAALAVLALCVVAAAALSHGADDARSQSVQSRPNIVVITADDQALNTPRGKSMPKTIKRIGQRGTTR